MTRFRERIIILADRILLGIQLQDFLQINRLTRKSLGRTKRDGYFMGFKRKEKKKKGRILIKGLKGM